MSILQFDPLIIKRGIIINSANLQKFFAKEYEDFFSTNNLIVSSPQTINRWNIAHLKDIKVRIVQKMPTKTYVGINIRKDDIINFKTITRFVHAKQRFENNSLELIVGPELAEKAKQKIKEKLLEYGFKEWLDISILSETEKDTGTQTYSTIILLVSLMIRIISGKLTINELNDYNVFVESGKFKEVYMVAKEIFKSVSPIPKEHLNMTSIFTAGINNGNIWIGLESKEYLQSTYPKIMKIENDFCIENTNWNLNRNIKKMIEFSIINFGWFFSEFYNTKTYLNISEQCEKIFKQFKISHNKWSVCADMINLLYFKIFQTAKEALLYPNDEYIVNNFFLHINKLWLYQSFIEEYMDLYNDITSTFKKNIIFEDEKIGLIPISSTKLWGTFLCITKSEKSRETLGKMIDELHEMWYGKAYFQYLSWEDGISEEHLKIEQYLDQNYFSSHIKENDVILEYGWWSQISYWKKIIGNHRRVLEETKDSIIFDSIDGKIHLNNEMTNHNEIFTQSGTVEIIKILFENMWKYVNNSKLPSSSYSKNKNEMVGKIIWPLQELIGKKYDKRLDLECTGSITDFDLKLTPNTINTYLIKKI
ncbi:MAG: hypothetical protein ACD_80C00129G0004 [uncultured bacterium (gcode 4)]|uniref:Uncharacterized protein n=1 Tax=uncultured bacterium (gcode 4) TaxID=1234023 RepID=K1YI50_9BACT|nr:MAG: hypothetical protein ACD_80C00129G0004 [uncultured bacterium (gcode 4)]